MHPDIKFKKFTVSGKTFKLPEILPFERTSLSEKLDTKYFYDFVDFRSPKKGEFFVSGAIPFAYQAYNDISAKYLIVERKEKAIKKTIWVRE